MNPNQADEMGWPEILAAYVDGEVDSVTAEVVQNRVSVDPDAHLELDAQWSFSPRNRVAWRLVEPDMPEPAQWSEMWKEINRSLSTEPVTRQSSRQRNWFRRGLFGVFLAVSTTAAAAAVFAVCVPRMERRHDGERPGVGPVTSEIFAVADSADVQLLSVRDVDLDQFVVGEGAVSSQLPIISGRNVRFESVPADWEVSPDPSKPEDDHAPLILMPSSRTR